MASMKSVDSSLKPNLIFLNHIKYEHLVAGVCGGLFSTLALHPLDVIKIRFAVNDGRLAPTPKYTGIADAFKTIYKQEGVYGLYRGITPNLWGAGSSWGLYFFFYNGLKTWVQGNDLNSPLNAGQHLLAASEAGIMTLIITNPMWVVKTRLCLQYSGSTHNVYSGMTDALISIYKTEGLKGYYRGFLPGVFGVSHGAVQFMVYEELKNQYNAYKGTEITTKLGTVEYLSFAAISKLMATALTYPYQVVRARLQNQHMEYRGMVDCVSETWKYEGWRGFYKGLGTNLLRVTPATMMTFLVYENVSHTLIKGNQKTLS